MPRTDAPLLAVLSRGSAELTAELINLSRTGARLKGSGFPEEGEELIFRAEKVMAACAVVWLDGDQCAVEFDTPIAAAEVARIRALAKFVEGVSTPREGFA